MAGIIGILISLGLLIYLAYRGISALIVAPLMAILAVLLSSDPSVLGSYTQIFMPALGQFAILYFPLFLLGAIFGKLMDDSGSAQVIAQRIVETLGKNRSILAIVLACAILTYGGVSLFVLAFAVYPIAAAMFQEADIPKNIRDYAQCENFDVVEITQDDGANASVLPLFNTASLVGFGAVIASLPAFELIRDLVLGIAPSNPLISLSVAVNILAGITGSASGGMSIALQTLGDRYLELSQSAGISPELMHLKVIFSSLRQ
jgi:H+/gluconate symporter-like permease